VSQHAIEALIPEDFGQWRIETINVAGRVMCTARRNGVTFTIVRDEQRWWTVNKIHGGKIVASFVVRQLPSRIQEIVNAGRQGRYAHAQ
jgi:hypothetical protein